MNLQLSLKKKWFEMTDCGIKTEDYRETTFYWYSRLCLFDGKKRSERWWRNYYEEDPVQNEDSHLIEFAYFQRNIMTSGYPKSTDTSRIRIYEHAGIEIRTGNPEWGAEPGKIYFVIKHGKRIK